MAITSGLGERLESLLRSRYFLYFRLGLIFGGGPLVLGLGLPGEEIASKDLGGPLGMNSSSSSSSSLMFTALGDRNLAGLLTFRLFLLLGLALTSFITLSRLNSSSESS